MKDFWFFILIGVCTSILFSSGQVENPDTHLRLAQARLLTENFEFGLPNDTGEDFHGNIAINSNGKRHMVYNPGQTLLFYPIYKLCDLGVKSNLYYTSTFVVSFINFFIHPFELSSMNFDLPVNTPYLTKFRYNYKRNKVEKRLNRIIELLKENDYNFKTFSQV